MSEFEPMDIEDELDQIIAQSVAEEEPKVEVEEAPPAPTKKRSRKVTDISGDGVTLINNRFMCNYSGEFSDYRVFIPGYETVASFRNLPCAVAYINIRGKTGDGKLRLINALLEHYQQTVIPSAAPVSDLNTFGGKLDYEQWMQDMNIWDTFTNEKGQSADEYLSQKSNTKRTAKKGGTDKINFESGAYLIGADGSTQAAAKAINCTDPLPEGAGRGKLSSASARRKQLNFLKKWTVKGEEGVTHCPFSTSLAAGESFVAIALTADEELSEEQTETLNIVASALTQTPCYGPTYVVFTKKMSIKI